MNKTQKPANLHPVGAAAQRPLTEEEKKVKIMQFLQQKRETIAVNVLCNLVHGAITNKNATNVLCNLVHGAITNKNATNVHVGILVDVAVDMADKLIEKLYPLPEQDKVNE